MPDYTHKIYRDRTTDDVTQEALAERLGIHAASLMDIEAGKILVSAGMYRKVRKALRDIMIHEAA